jgi:hypothetical protein
MSTSLWPNFAGVAAPRGMMEMLLDLAGDIGQQTNGDIDFYVDALGVGASGVIKDVRYNCYLRVVKRSYTYFLFRVTTPVGSPFPATAATPEGEQYADLKDEAELRNAVKAILQRPRTADIVRSLLQMVPKPVP